MDVRLGNKSDVAHKHEKADVLDFPDSMKNPQPLVINGNPYDGSAALALDLIDVEALENLSLVLLDTLMEKTELLLAEKADVVHEHDFSDVRDIYSYVAIDDLLQERDDRITELEGLVSSLEDRVATLESA